jgi:replicative DNA helicase
MLAQVSRESGKSGKTGSRPYLTDLRESGNIEQDADLVAFLHRPEYYGLKVDDSGNSTHNVCEVIIAKHRDGAIGDVRVRFISRIQLWEEMSEAQEVPEVGLVPDVKPKIRKMTNDERGHVPF